jgi:uncharacterized HAD superfamily protein
VKFDTLIIDIDGTIADNSHRQHVQNEIDQYLRGPKFSAKDADKILRELWNEFYRLAKDDVPVLGSLSGVKKLLGSDDKNLKCPALIYCTGREDSFRADTTSWLADQGFPLNVLLMRPTGDTRPSTVVKEHLLSYLPKTNQVLAVDDEDRILSLFHTLGFATLKAPFCWERISK